MRINPISVTSYSYTAPKKSVEQKHTSPEVNFKGFGSKFFTAFGIVAAAVVTGGVSLVPTAIGGALGYAGGKVLDNADKKDLKSDDQDYSGRGREY